MAINPLSSLPASILPPSGGAGGAGEAAAPGGAFSDILKTMVTQAVNSQSEANAISTAAATGQNVPLQDVVQALGKAELTLQTLVSVRDRAIEAYQEILRMPI